MAPVRLVLTIVVGASVVAALTFAASDELIGPTSAVAVSLAVVDAVLAVVIGWMVVGRSRSVALGPLIQLTGLWVVASMVRHADPGTSGQVLSGAVWLAGACLPALILWHVPDGLDQTRRRAVWLSAFLVVAAAIPPAVIGGDAGPGTTNAAGVVTLPVPDGARTALAVQSVLVLVFTAAALAGLVRRRREYRLGGRSLLDPLVVSGCVWLLALGCERFAHLQSPDRLRQYTIDVVGGFQPWAGFVAINVPLAAVGVLLSAAGYVLVVRPRLERGADGSVVVDDRSLGDPVSELVTWVGDPSLRVSYADGEGGWVDAEGRPARSDRPELGRTILLRDGVAIARIDHDPSLLAAPDVVTFAAVVTGGAIEAEAAAAAADARVAEARRLAARLVNADHATRTALMAELEAGPLLDLLDCAELLRGRADLAEVTQRLKQITASTRSISHGLYPPELIDGGLAAALGRQGASPRRRLPRAVEVTAYLLARDDPGATFVDHGTMLEMHLTRAPVSQDAVDRVRILGGTVGGSTVEIPTGGV